MPASSKKNKDIKDSKENKSKVDRSVSMFFNERIKKVTSKPKLKISVPFITKEAPNIKLEYSEAKSMFRFERLMSNVSVSKVRSSVAKSLAFNSDSDSEEDKKMKLPDAKKEKTTLPDLSFFSSSSSSDSEEELDKTSVVKSDYKSSISYESS